MKTILILLTITIFTAQAAQKEYIRDIPKNVVCVQSTAFINSKDAFFIIGNYKHGMMQKSWAFSTREGAQRYADKNGGCIVDYETYVKMDDKAVKEYVKEHGIVITKDTNTTKIAKDNSTKKSNTNLR